MEKKREFKDLLDVMARLRGPGGCPWDREQNHESILKCLIEEAYEFLDAVHDKDETNMVEELGDILLQVVFHSQMASEENRFTIDDVIHGITDKLIRRHPHVFGDVAVTDSNAVLRNWERIKKSEKEKKSELFDGVPSGLPALDKAEKIQKKAAKTGFDWPDANGPLEKVYEEAGEIKSVAEQGTAEEKEEELGDLLFAAVNLARHLNVDPSLALEKSNRKFIRRFLTAKKLAISEGNPFENSTLEDMDRYWSMAKSQE